MVRYASVVAMGLCALLLSAHAAEAQYFGRNKVRHDRLDFRLLQTDHFDIYYYAEEEAATRDAARMAERWYARYSRLLDHTFTRRQTLVLYASHPHFAQTNLTTESPGEGTGGFTERTKSRIAMPFAAGLGETDHVLGHEIAHAFQIDIVKSVHQNAFALPGWVIEGMAEYLSLGPANVHTAMWMRDAVINDHLPTLAQLNDPRYFPYRYGHAFWSYLGERYGDAIIGRVLRSKKRNALERLEDTTGIDAQRLTREWHEAIASRHHLSSIGQSAPPSADRARIHVGPSLSPDGRRLMFLSERDRLSLDLFMADAATGRIIRKVVSSAADPHFDSLQYIHSAGSWDPTGRRFAMTALRSGNPVLVLVDVDGGTRREIPLKNVREIYNPSWAPDGERIVFSALKDGLSDLFVYTLRTDALEQLTADVFADLHPAWSPDGRSIAFTTDRFTSVAADLQFGAMRVGLLTLATGAIRPLAVDVSSAKQINPQWAPNGDALYFVSDRTGVSNVYRIELDTLVMSQVTHVDAGVSGITATSPSLAVAAQAGTLAFSVYRDGRYDIETMSQSVAVAQATVDNRSNALVETSPADVVDPAAPSATGISASAMLDETTPPSVASLLADASHGLPPTKDFPVAPYNDRLGLESLAQPYVGAATGDTFGGIIRTTFGFTFGDLLRDRQLQAMFRLGTDTDDLAAQMMYLNRRNRWDWGFTAGVLPTRFYGAKRAIDRGDTLITRETSTLRYMHEWGGFAARYNIDRARRVELGAGVRRTGFAWQTVTRVIDPALNKVLSRDLTETSAGRPVHLAETSAAFVHDTSVSGPTGPVLGQRVRLEIEPALGALNFADVRIDARRYLMPVRPITLAARIEHVGRYGPSAADPRLTPLVAGLQTFVRGYNLESFAADECGRTATQCSIVDELTGGRLALVNLEVRAPIPGLFTGQLSYSQLPIEALAFVDAGFLWTRHQAGGMERDRFRSVGAGARVNVGGIVFEITAARPFDRPVSGWTMSFLLRPGW